MRTLPCSERHRVVKRQPYLLTLQLRGQSVLSNDAGSGAAAAERKVGTRFWSSQPRNRISRHRADRSEYDYRSTTEVDKTITSQIVAHNQSYKSTTKIQDPKLTSDRLRAGFPSGRTVGRSSGGTRPQKNSVTQHFPRTPMCAPFLFVDRELGASKRASGCSRSRLRNAPISISLTWPPP